MDRLQAGLIKNLLQFFCTCCPCQPNATTMRSTEPCIVNPCKIPENYVNSTSAQYQTDGGRAGLKSRAVRGRSGRENSPTFHRTKAVAAYRKTGRSIEHA
jgi:hypothetical protein